MVCGELELQRSQHLDLIPTLAGEGRRMRLYWYRGIEPNFGDELNQFVWPKLLPGAFDDDASTIFLGIGSILFDNHPPTAQKIVMGAGYGGYTAPPDVSDGTWNFRFVRGPRTATQFGLDPKLAIADSGILVRSLIDRIVYEPKRVSFIPHVASLRRGQWKSVCEVADIQFIDPRAHVETVISQLLQSKVVIAEAMHGAIIADALRVPWIPVYPMNPLNRMKWLDWAESLTIDYRPVSLIPSTLNELKLTRLSGNRVASKLVSMLNESALGCGANQRLLELSANRLRKISSGSSYLSNEGNLERATSRMLDKVEELRRTLHS